MKKNVGIKPPEGCVVYNMTPQRGDDRMAFHFSFDSLVIDSVMSSDRDHYWNSLNAFKVLLGSIVMGGSMLVAEEADTTYSQPFFQGLYRKAFKSVTHIDNYRYDGQIRNYFLLEDKCI